MLSSWVKDKKDKLKAKLVPEPGLKLGFEEAQKASVSVASSKPKLATRPEVGLESSLEVCNLPVSSAG